MNFLFNSHGQQIACEMNGVLFSPGGQAIGWLVKGAGIFADQSGRYLGEIVCVNRLVYNRCSRYRHTSFGPTKSRGSVGAKVATRKCSAITLPPGYEDVRLDVASASA